MNNQFDIDEDKMLASELLRMTIALVLAGGRGSRLKDLTESRAKPAVHFGGKFRIIDFTLSNCINSGIRRIGILTQYQCNSLIKHIQRGWSFFSPSMNEFVDLLPAQQRTDGDNWYVNTGDAIYQNIDIIKRYKSKYVIILGGDHIYKMDYSKMLLDHVKKGAKCTVSCIKVPVDEANAFGIMDIDESEKIKGFIEKPTNPPTIPNDSKHCLASMGIYIFDSQYLMDILKNDHVSLTSSHDFGKDIIPKAVDEGVAWAHPFEYSCVTSNPDNALYWRDVGTVDSFWQANLDLASIVPELNIYDQTWPIHTYVKSLPPAKHVQNDEGGHGMIINSLVSPGSIICGSMIINSILFLKVRVESFCHIDSSLLFPDVVVGANTRLRKCIIDRACRIPSNFVIGENVEDDKKRGFCCTEQGVVLVTRKMLQNLGIDQL